MRILDNGFDPTLDEVEKGAESVVDQGGSRDVVLPAESAISFTLRAPIRVKQ